MACSCEPDWPGKAGAIMYERRDPALCILFSYIFEIAFYERRASLVCRAPKHRNFMILLRNIIRLPKFSTVGVWVNELNLQGWRFFKHLAIDFVFILKSN